MMRTYSRRGFTVKSSAATAFDDIFRETSKGGFHGYSQQSSSKEKVPSDTESEPHDDDVFTFSDDAKDEDYVLPQAQTKKRTREKISNVTCRTRSRRGTNSDVNNIDKENEVSDAHSPPQKRKAARKVASSKTAAAKTTTRKTSRQPTKRKALQEKPAASTAGDKTAEPAKSVSDPWTFDDEPLDSQPDNWDATPGETLDDDSQGHQDVVSMLWDKEETGPDERHNDDDNDDDMAKGEDVAIKFHQHRLLTTHFENWKVYHESMGEVWAKLLQRSSKHRDRRLCAVVLDSWRASTQNSRMAVEIGLRAYNQHLYAAAVSGFKDLLEETHRNQASADAFTRQHMLHSALTAWKAAGDDVLALTEAATQHYTSYLQLRCLKGWQQEADRAVEIRALNAVGHRQRFVCGVAFRHWAACVAQQLEARKTLSAMHHSTRVMQGVLDSWRKIACEQRESEIAAIQHWHQSSLRRTILCWVEVVQEFRREKFTTADSHWRQWRLRGAFRAWKAQTDHSREAFVEKAVAHDCHRVYRKVFRAWGEHNLIAKEKMDLAQTHCTVFSLRKALEAWKSDILFSRTLLERARGHFEQRLRGVVVQQWYEYVTISCAAMRKTAIQFESEASLRRGWSGWRDLLVESREQYGVACSHNIRNQLQKSLAALRSEVSRVRDNEVSADQHCQNTMMNRTFTVWQRSTVHAIAERLQQVGESRDRLLCQRVLRLWSRTHKYEVEARDNLVHLSLQARSLRMLSLGLSEWKAFVTESKSLSLADSVWKRRLLLGWASAALECRTFRHAESHYTRRQLYQLFGSWKAWVSSELEVRDSTAAGHHAMHCLRVTFHCWEQFCKDQSASWEEVYKKHRRLYANSLARKCLAGWRSWCREQVATAAAETTPTTAVETTVSAADETIATDGTASAAAETDATASEMVASVATDSTSTAIPEVDEPFAENHCDEADDSLMCTAEAHYATRLMHHVFSAWMSISRAESSKKRRADLHWEHRAQLRSFAAWWHEVCVAKTRAETATEYHRVMTTRSVWVHWLDWVEEAVIDRQQAEQEADVWNKTQKLFSAFTMWMQYTHERAHTRCVLATFTQSRKSRLLARVLAGWNLQTSISKQHAHVLCAGQQRRHRALLVAGLRGLQWYLEQCESTRSKIAAFVKTADARWVGMCFTGWRQALAHMVHARKEAEGRLSLFRRKWEQKVMLDLLVEVFSSLRRNVLLQRAVDRERGCAADELRRHFQADRGYRVISVFLDQLRTEVQDAMHRCAKAVTHANRYLQRRVVRSWFRQSLRQREQSNAVCATISIARQKRMLRLILGEWKDITNEAKALLLEQHQRRVRFLLRMSVNAWCAFTAASRQKRVVLTRAERWSTRYSMHQAWRAWNHFLAEARHAKADSPAPTDASGPSEPVASKSTMQPSLLSNADTVDKTSTSQDVEERPGTGTPAIPAAAQETEASTKTDPKEDATLNAPSVDTSEGVKPSSFLKKRPAQREAPLPAPTHSRPVSKLRLPTIMRLGSHLTADSALESESIPTPTPVDVTRGKHSGPSDSILEAEGPRSTAATSGSDRSAGSTEENLVNNERTSLESRSESEKSSQLPENSVPDVDNPDLFESKAEAIESKAECTEAAGKSEVAAIDESSCEIECDKVAAGPTEKGTADSVTESKVENTEHCSEGSKRGKENSSEVRGGTESEVKDSGPTSMPTAIDGKCVEEHNGLVSSSTPSEITEIQADVGTTAPSASGTEAETASRHNVHTSSSLYAMTEFKQAENLPESTTSETKPLYGGSSDSPCDSKTCPGPKPTEEDVEQTISEPVASQPVAVPPAPASSTTLSTTLSTPAPSSTPSTTPSSTPSTTLSTTLSTTPSTALSATLSTAPAAPAGKRPTNIVTSFTSFLGPSKAGDTRSKKVPMSTTPAPTTTPATLKSSASRTPTNPTTEASIANPGEQPSTTPANTDHKPNNGFKNISTSSVSFMALAKSSTAKKPAEPAKKPVVKSLLIAAQKSKLDKEREEQRKERQHALQNHKAQAKAAKAAAHAKVAATVKLSVASTSTATAARPGAPSSQGVGASGVKRAVGPSGATKLVKPAAPRSATAIPSVSKPGVSKVPKKTQLVTPTNATAPSKSRVPSTRPPGPTSSQSASTPSAPSTTTGKSLPAPMKGPVRVKDALGANPSPKNTTGSEASTKVSLSSTTSSTAAKMAVGSPHTPTPSTGGSNASQRVSTATTAAASTTGGRKSSTESNKRDSASSDTDRDWAFGPGLDAALLLQQDIDGHKIFGEVLPINLEDVFGVGKERYRKRTSSGFWGNSGSPLLKR